MRSEIERSADTRFVLTLRRRWADTLYPAFGQQFGEQLCSGEGAADEASIRALPAYPWFSWLERGSQKMLWRAVTEEVRASGPAVDGGTGALLELDPSLELPDWYTDWDIHVQPGGVWSSMTSFAPAS